jgi:hypothetical protein
MIHAQTPANRINLMSKLKGDAPEDVVSAADVVGLVVADGPSSFLSSFPPFLRVAIVLPLPAPRKRVGLVCPAAEISGARWVSASSLFSAATRWRHDSAQKKKFRLPPPTRNTNVWFFWIFGWEERALDSLCSGEMLSNKKKGGRGRRIGERLSVSRVLLNKIGVGPGGVR